MDTFKFLIDPNETRVTIDCSSYQQALYSVASLLKREPDEMLSSIYKIGNTLKFNHSQGVFEEILAEQVVGERYFSINVDKVCWFHFTRVHISLTYKEGLLPSKKNVSKVWENLVNIFSPIDRKIIDNFQYM